MIVLNIYIKFDVLTSSNVYARDTQLASLQLIPAAHHFKSKCYIVIVLSVLYIY